MSAHSRYTINFWLGGGESELCLIACLLTTCNYYHTTM